MIKFYQPITTISSMIGTVTGSILNIIERSFPEKFFNHVYVDTRLASVEQRKKKKKLIGFRPPALGIKPNFLLEETLIDATDILPFCEVIINDPEKNILIEAVMERVKFSMEIRLKIESKLKTWDVIGWLKRYFIYKAPAIIPNTYLDTIIPSNLVKDLLKFKGMSQTLSDVDSLITYLNINTKSMFEFSRRFNSSIGKSTILFRHPENILYTINDYPQPEFNKKGLSDSENYINLEMTVETWFPVGFKTNFQKSLDGGIESPEIGIDVGEIIDYEEIYIPIDIIDIIDNPTIDINDPFFPADDLYIPSDDPFADESDEFSDLDDLFNLINDDIIKKKIKLYLKNYNASKDNYYNFDVILGKDSVYDHIESAYENFLNEKNYAKLGIHKSELVDHEKLTIDMMNSPNFKQNKYCPNQQYGNFLRYFVLPKNDITDVISAYNPPSDSTNSFEIEFCNVSQELLDIIDNDIIPDPIDEEIDDNENESEFLLNPNNNLLDYYLDDDAKQVTLTFYGQMTHPDYDSDGRRKIFSTYFVSDINEVQDTLELYNEFSNYYKDIIAFILNSNVNYRDIFKIYLYSRNGDLIKPEYYTFDWTTLKLTLNKPYRNMTYNIVFYANMVKLKYYADEMNKIN